MVFQFFNLLDDLTVADNVMLPAQLAGMARARGAAPARPSCSARSASTGTPARTRAGCPAASGSGSRSPGR